MDQNIFNQFDWNILILKGTSPLTIKIHLFRLDIYRTSKKFTTFSESFINITIPILF